VVAVLADSVYVSKMIQMSGCLDRLARVVKQLSCLEVGVERTSAQNISLAALSNWPVLLAVTRMIMLHDYYEKAL